MKPEVGKSQWTQARPAGPQRWERAVVGRRGAPFIETNGLLDAVGTPRAWLRDVGDQAIRVALSPAILWLGACNSARFDNIPKANP